jgi:hypothetical protein
MRFSEAFLLGESLKRPDARVWFRPDPDTGGPAGCAIFGAALAAGFSIRSQPEPQAWSVFDTDRNYVYVFRHDYHVDRLFEFVAAQWPWITPEVRYWISQLYCRVAHGIITIENMADWIRDVEPKEPNEMVRSSGSICLDVLLSVG